MHIRSFGIILFAVLTAACVCHGGQSVQFGSQDLYLSAQTVTFYEKAGDVEIGHVLLFEDGFKMTVGSNILSSDQAFVWIRSIETGYRGVIRIDHDVYVYLDGNVSVKRGKTAKTTDLQQTVVEQSNSLVARFAASGEVFVEAQQRNNAPMTELEGRAIYKKAVQTIEPVQPRPVIVPEAMVPGVEVKADSKVAVPDGSVGVAAVEQEDEQTYLDQIKNFPVNIAGVREPAPDIQATTEADGRKGCYRYWKILSMAAA